MSMFEETFFLQDAVPHQPETATCINTFFFLNDLFLYSAIDTVFHTSGIIQNGMEYLYYCYNPFLMQLQNFVSYDQTINYSRTICLCFENFFFFRKLSLTSLKQPPTKLMTLNSPSLNAYYLHFTPLRLKHQLFSQKTRTF